MRRYGHLIAPAILLLGLLLRLREYLFVRSLWLDEASLALNIVERGLGGLLQPLANMQAAPYGFMAATELITRFLGISEWSLRLLPFLAGCAALVLFYVAVRRCLSPWGGTFALFLFAISTSLIRYSNEFKPYAVDTLCALALLLLLLEPLRQGHLAIRKAVLVGGVGALLIWFSFPVIFVMAAFGGLLFLQALRAKDRAFLQRTLLMGLFWLSSFAVFYFTYAAPSRANPGLADYWLERGGFMPLPPTSLQDLFWFTGTAFNYFETVAGLHQLGHTGLLLCGLGIAAFWLERSYRLLAALLLPVLLVLAASGAHLYPFSERLILFTAPLALLLVGNGIDGLVRLDRRRGPVYAGVLMALTLISPTAYAAVHFLRPHQVEEVRPLMEAAAPELTADDIFFAYPNDDAFRFYAWKLNVSVIPREIQLEAAGPWARLLAEQPPGDGEIWIGFAHHDATKEAVLQPFRERFEEVRSLQAVGAELYAFRMGEH